MANYVEIGTCGYSDVESDGCCLSAVDGRSSIMYAFQQNTTIPETSIPESAVGLSMARIAAEDVTDLFGFYEIYVANGMCSEGIRYSENSLMIYSSRNCSENNARKSYNIRTERQNIQEPILGNVTISKVSIANGSMKQTFLSHVPNDLYFPGFRFSEGVLACVIIGYMLVAFLAMFYFAVRFSVQYNMIHLGHAFCNLLVLANWIVAIYLVYPGVKASNITLQTKQAIFALATLISALNSAAIYLWNTESNFLVRMIVYSVIVLTHVAIAGGYYLQEFPNADYKLAWMGLVVVFNTTTLVSRYIAVLTKPKLSYYRRLVRLAWKYARVKVYFLYQLLAVVGWIAVAVGMVLPTRHFASDGNVMMWNFSADVPMTVHLISHTFALHYLAGFGIPFRDIRQ